MIKKYCLCFEHQINIISAHKSNINEILTHQLISDSLSRNFDSTALQTMGSLGIIQMFFDASRDGNESHLPIFSIKSGWRFFLLMLINGLLIVVIYFVSLQSN